MAMLLERPPTKPQPMEERPPVASIATAHDAVSFEHWWRHLSAHDQMAALLLAIGEYGALAHGAAWATVLRVLTNRSEHAR